MKGLFAKLFTSAQANSQQQEVSADFNGEAAVTVKFSVADQRVIKISDEVTVGDVIKAAANLSNVNLSRDYTVVANGRAVSLDEKYVNGTRYSVTFLAGEAG